MIYMIVITFLFSIAVAFAVLLLFIRQNRLLHLEEKYERLNDELNETITSFFIQMREENEQFIERFQQLNKTEYLIEKENHAIKGSKPFPNPGDAKIRQHKKTEEKPPVFVPNYTGIKEYKKILEKSPLPETEETTRPFDDGKNEDHPATENLAYEIRRLYEMGHSVEEIAKLLDKGKTEIELFIKFNSPRTENR